MLNYPSQKIVTVCDKCLTETCLKGQFPCAERVAGQAGSVTNTEERLSCLQPSTIETAASTRGLESHGPFEVHRITLDGYLVPRLHGRIVGDMWYFQLDGRFAVDVPKMYGLGVAWMIANALAIGAGYSCFGENSAPRNEFKSRLHCITGAFTQEAVNEDAAQIN